MFERWAEGGLMDVLGNNGVGCIPFSPLAQGLLSDKYLSGNIPQQSRAAKSHGALQTEAITSEILRQINALNDIATKRNQSLAQMAIAWLLKDKRVTTVLVGVSTVEQLHNNLGSLNNLNFNKEELVEIENILTN